MNNIVKTFTSLHNHSDYSLLDGLGKIEDYVKTGLALGMQAMAFTDHGTMAGLVTAYDTCQKYGMKFIGGFEAYIAPHGQSRFQQKGEENRAYNHLIILFKNKTGYENGCILLTRSNTEGFYYKPRIDFDLLKEHHEGLVILSACLAGSIPQALLAGNYEKAKQIALDYKNVFGDDYYLEIQDHGMPEDKIAIQGLLRLSQECDIKLVATNDCHYVHPEDKEAHHWLLCMKTTKTINEENRMINDGDYHLKSEAEMLQLFPYCPQAVYNTQEIVEKCNFQFEYGNYRMPKVKIPKEYGKDYYRYLQDEAWKGFELRYPAPHKKREEAKKRLNYELSIIKQMNFAQYFLDIRKTIVKAKDNGILVGPGRGSGVGSCMNYCLKITDLEPLQYNLLFERFLNPERVSMPDIDTDFEYLRKDDVLQEEAEDYGHDCFAKIETFGTMQAKNVLKSCAKVSGIEHHVAVGTKLAKFITNNQTLKEAWDLDPDLQNYVHSDPRIEKIWEISLKLEGTKKSAGTHACGHIPTPIPCERLFPCRVDSETGYLVCEYDMNQAEHLGNLKKDLLMLRNLTIIDTAHREIKRRTGKNVPLWTDEILNNKKALQMIANGDTNGVFQLESDGMKRFMRQLKPDCFEDIIAGVALYRPGPMEYINDYIRNKHNPQGIHYLTPKLKPILESTYGIIVFQEQVMLIVQQLAGFSMGRADLVRKAMGKKKQEIMDQEGPHFIYGDESLGIKGCKNNGIPVEIAKQIWEQMVDFAKYAFNKSHAAAYAAISMQTAYLKANYPLEFAAGLLTSVMDDSKKLMKYITAYRQEGIVILPPDVNRSMYDFSIEQKEGNECIRFGLSALSGVGKEISNQIPKERENKPYQSLDDFIMRHLSINKQALESMAKAGALDSFGYTRHTLMENLGDMLTHIRKEEKKKDPNQLTLFDFGMEETKEQRQLTEYPEYGFLKRCQLEKDATGMYISGHPAAVIQKTAKENGAVDIEALIDEHSDIASNATVSIAGVITELERKLTKRGTTMILMKVEDQTGSIPVMVFDAGIQKYGTELIEGCLVFLTGKTRGEGEDKTMIMDSASRLKEVCSTLWIRSTSNSLTELEKAARQFQKKHAGIGDRLIIVSKDNSTPKLIGEIALNEDTLTEARLRFKPENVKVSQKLRIE